MFTNELFNADFIKHINFISMVLSTEPAGSPLFIKG